MEEKRYQPGKTRIEFVYSSEPLKYALTVTNRQMKRRLRKEEAKKTQ